MNAEPKRLADPKSKKWGPYLSERQWGTVREDYSEGGAAWDHFPHDYARATDPEVLADLWQRLAAPCDEPCGFDELTRHDASSLGHALEILLDRVAGQVVCVDLTHPALGVPVVKVIVPGRAVDLEAMG